MTPATSGESGWGLFTRVGEHGRVLRTALQSVRRVSLSPRRLLLVSLALVLAAAVGGAVAFDHPAAQVGVGQRHWSSFETVTDGDGAYAVTVVHAVETSAGTRGTAISYRRAATGSYVETVRPTAGATLPESDLAGRAVAQFGDVRYERETYPPGSDPATLAPDVYADGDGHVVSRDQPAGSVGAGYATGVERILATQVYARAGTTTRNGTTFTRYDVLGSRRPVARLTGSGVTGYLLVDPAGRVRCAELRTTAAGGDALTYRATPGAAPTVPDWVATAREAFDASGSRPDLRAYRRGGRVLLLAEDQWTPERPATVALLSGDGEPVATARLPAGEPAFQRRGDVYLAAVTATPDGAVLGAAPPGGTWAHAPERLVVDRRGRNLYDRPVEPGSRLGSVQSVVAAHFRPRNGGGRVLRVDGLRIDEALAQNGTVTLAVGNGTASRSVTVPARNLSGDRFYLLRTPTGLAVRNAGGIAVHVRPPTRFADRRFVADARLRVTVDGVPVVTRPVPRQATRAGERSLDRLLTGVGITAYDEPPDRSLLGRGPELRAMNWTGYTFVAIHSWDYDALAVRGGADVAHPVVVREDHTSYVRARDGTRFWIETENGTRIYEGLADGSAQVST